MPTKGMRQLEDSKAGSAQAARGAGVPTETLLEGECRRACQDLRTSVIGRGKQAGGVGWDT